MLKLSGFALQATRDHIRLIRPQDMPDIWLMLLLGVVAASPAQFPTTTFVYLVVGLGCFLAYVHITNDIADIQIDRVNAPDRPLPSGRVPIHSAQSLAKIYVVATLIAGLFAGPIYALILLGTILLGAAYSSKKTQLSHRHVWAIINIIVPYFLIPFVLGYLAVSPRQDIGTLAALLLTAIVLIAIGRLPLKDYRDSRGDNLYAKKTALVRFGAEKTRIGMLIAYGLGAVLYAYAVFSHWQSGALAQFLQIGALVLLVAVGILLYTTTRNRTGTIVALEGYGHRRGILAVYYLLRLLLIATVAVVWLHQAQAST